MATVIIVLVLVLMVGLALTDVTSRDMRNSYSNWQREQALAAAEGGVDYAVWWISNNTYTAQTTSSSNSLYGFIPSSGTTLLTSDPGTPNLSMPAPPQGSGAPFKVGIYDGSYYPTTGAWLNDRVLVCTASQGNDTVSIQVVLQNTTENVFPWNNALFAGGSQNGSGSQASIHGPVDLLGTGISSSTAAISFTGGTNSGIFDNYSDGVTPPTYWVSGQDNGSGAAIPPLESGGPVYANISTLLPTLPTDTSGNSTLDSKLRVANGTVAISSPSRVGLTDHLSGIDSTVDGVYVTDGFTTGSSAYVSSDNGTTKPDDASVPVPSLQDAAVGHPSETQLQWDHDSTNPAGVLVLSSLTLGRDEPNKYTVPHIPYILGTYPTGPYIKQTWHDITQAADSHEDYFDLEIKGIIYVQGPVVIGNNHAGSKGGVDIITYTGSGTIIAGTTGAAAPVYGSNTNNIDSYAQIIAGGSASLGSGFVGPDDTSINPVPLQPRNVLGLVATGDINIHDSHLAVGQGRVMAGLYAEHDLTFEDQTNFFGSAVARHNFTLSGQPSLNFVPELALHLPPGLPDTGAITVGGISVVNYQQLQ